MTRVTAVQLAPVVGELQRNIDAACTAIEAAVTDGASIVVLPELTTSGYVFESRAEALGCAVTREHPLFARCASLLADDGVLIVGFAEAADGDVFNSAAVVTRSGVTGVYRKVHLWDQEKRWFTPGDEPPLLVDTAHGRMGVMICFDLEFPEWPRIAALRGADLLAVPTNWPLGPRPEGERVPEVQIALATARMNHMAIAFADRTGTERGVEWSEGTGIADADGWLRGAAGAGIGSVSAELDLPASRNKRQAESVDLLGDRRPDLYGGLLA